MDCIVGGWGPELVQVYTAWFACLGLVPLKHTVSLFISLSYPTHAPKSINYLMKMNVINYSHYYILYYNTSLTVLLTDDEDVAINYLYLYLYFVC
jgi:hypothetical protein